MLDGMHLSDVVFRFLSLCDIEEVKALCKLWFPLDYPNTWYNDVLSNPQFFSLAACHSNNIIGLIVAEIKEASRVNEEDSSLLDYGLIYNADVAYILALGVMEEYRRCGIASLLLDTFLRHLTAQEMKKVKVVYLHVLATNDKALRFYEKRNFRMHAFLPYYYCIGDKMRDGFTYCLYVNGGHPPWTFLYPFVTPIMTNR
ncbi:hypothetical protein QYM36_008871 [Artemia franciscana]|uniref:N-alpha-acetyltransferase 60 n=1 Tax=Artemia franciscana TaxID=6661 RepID=A0AA88L6G7_ARTSF|nr:hypothetical protein QYM36_008871 [Artemia franciscana]